jgi:Lanthionine synthetase C-like protein
VQRGGASLRWPAHARDLDAGDDPALDSTTLYFGAAGVLWALRYLASVGAIDGFRLGAIDWPGLHKRNRANLARWGSEDFGSYLMGDLPIAMMAIDAEPQGTLVAALPELVESNVHHPARELMWGSPGSLLACAFLHECTGDARWAERFVRIAAQLRAELNWSDEQGCHYWPQDLYGRRCSYLDAVHGFVATAHALARGSTLLPRQAWLEWQSIIVQTVTRTATREGDLVNWPPELIVPPDRPPRWLMQYCHGAPGFVICLARMPREPVLDELLAAAGRAAWAAGPLAKGSNLCHGTAGNGYAFLKLHERTGDGEWLRKARAFAMHAIAQAEAEATVHGQLRYSLWTGDLGLAIYLWDCLRGRSAFPTLDTFYGSR